jgi:Tol biopolymer transport system component
MSIDQRGERAAERLRAGVVSELAEARMLHSLRRTRLRRRVVSSGAAAVVVVAVLLATTVPHRDSGAPVGPGPSSPTTFTTPPARANGAVFGYGTPRLLHPAGLTVPTLSLSSTPTWSPDGSRVATLAGGILVTEVHSGRTRLLPCPGCSEIAWSPDGRTIAATTTLGTGSPLLLVDVATERLRGVPLPGIRQVRALTWAPDSSRIAFLAVRPVAEEGAWTVGPDGSSPQRFVEHATSLQHPDPENAAILAMDWAPTRAEVAVLYATYDPSRKTFRLDVWTMSPDGSKQAHLLANGTCACLGEAPDLVWSPDGRILLLSSQVHRPDRTRLDGDGMPIEVRFVTGASGPLSWQPLPR